MSNLILKLPTNDFYNPSPEEIKNFNKLIPKDDAIMYNEILIISSITSFIIILVLYIILWYQKHSINTTTLIITYLIIVMILCICNIMSTNITRLLSSLL